MGGRGSCLHYWKIKDLMQALKTQTIEVPWHGRQTIGKPRKLTRQLEEEQTLISEIRMIELHYREPRRMGMRKY